jgi:hypothetical protein
MIDKIIGAFTFKTGVYKEVEEDTSFTPNAWLIVAAAALLSNLGSSAGSVHAIGARWIVGALSGTVVTVASFALGAFVMNWAGRTFFNADVTYDELIRTIGLASVWNAVGFLGIIALAAPGLTCITGPITFLAAIAGLAAWFFAAKEALDLDWPQTIGAVIIGWVTMMIVAALVSGVILGLLGLTAAGMRSIFSTVGGSL